MTTTVETEHTTDYNNDTWLSLLELLHPSEVFVTVDQTNLWRKHLSWSKPDGQDLRNYTTQRFSSNMILLSLILSAEMNVLFNSSTITTDIRTQMMNDNYGSVRLWIGMVILLSACVTVIALVSTFTAWGMISSIGDRNVHCLLRSSIGQLVTSLPSNYVVASLYLFLCWLVLFIIELTKGPLRILLMVVVMYLFFQTVVSLSAFGRLIIHTGAMGKTPVLDPALEKALLPSGLHASLLIKATDRKRRQTSLLSMYRTPKRKVKSNSSSSRTGSQSAGDATCSLTKKQQGGSVLANDGIDNVSRFSGQTSDTEQSPTVISTCSSTATRQPLISPSEEIAIIEAARAFGCATTSFGSDDSMSSFSNQPEKELLLQDIVPSYGSDANLMTDECSPHLFRDLHESFGSLRSFPRASVLNMSTNSTELKKIVEDALSSSSRGTNRQGKQAKTETPLRGGVGGSRNVDKVRFSSQAQSDSVPPKKATVGRQRRSILAGFRQASTRDGIKEEWRQEEDVRSMYNIAPPAEVVFDDEVASDTDDDWHFGDTDNIMPRPSILNQTRRLKSLRRLASGSSRDPSVGSEDKRADSYASNRGDGSPSKGNPCDIESAGGEDEEDGLVGERIHILSNHSNEHV